MSNNMISESTVTKPNYDEQLRWSIGMGREVRIEQVLADGRLDVSYTEGDVDRAVTRAADDLAQPFRPGQVAYVREDEDKPTMLGVVTARAIGGCYFWVPGRHRQDEGDLFVPWREVRTYCREASTEGDNTATQLVRDLYAAWLDVNQKFIAKADAYLREQAEAARFREQVAEVASRYARENDWCSVVESALGELGLELIKSRYRVDVVMRFSVDVDADDEDEAREEVAYMIDGVAMSGHEEERNPSGPYSVDTDVRSAERITEE